MVNTVVQVVAGFSFPHSLAEYFGYHDTCCRGDESAGFRDNRRFRREEPVQFAVDYLRKLFDGMHFGRILNREPAAYIEKPETINAPRIRLLEKFMANLQSLDKILVIYAWLPT